MTSSYSSCWDFVSKGKCPRGEKCKWEHHEKLYSKPSAAPNLSINVPPPDLSIPDESQFCWNYARTGACPRGSSCRWIHELIMMPWPTPAETGLAFPSTPEGNWDRHDASKGVEGWDQFAHRPASSFDSSYYTTPLVVDHLTPEQIAKADLLSKVALPSESLGQITACQFCKESFTSMDRTILHFKDALVSDGDSHADLVSAAKRRSWIVVQESLPAGLVSQIDGLYKRPITSSTNLINMIDCVANTTDVDLETKEYLLRELVCVAVQKA